MLGLDWLEVDCVDCRERREEDEGWKGYGNPWWPIRGGDLRYRASTMDNDNISSGDIGVGEAVDIGGLK